MFKVMIALTTGECKKGTTKHEHGSDRYFLRGEGISCLGKGIDLTIGKPCETPVYPLQIHLKSEYMQYLLDKSVSAIHVLIPVDSTGRAALHVPRLLGVRPNAVLASAVPQKCGW